jgi:iron complex outermembrane receptor protein
MYQDFTFFQRRPALIAAGSAWMLNVLRFFIISLLLACLVGSLKSAEPLQAGWPFHATEQPDITQLVGTPIPKVTTPSKFEQKVTEAPSAVTVIEADEIKKYGHRTLADVLRSVRGLHVSYDRNNSFLGARGFNRGDFNSRILLLVDGHRVNNNLSDGALIGTDFILDVDLIERVEIVRGPGSVLYGNNAFFGVINVITRKGRDQPGYGAEFSGEYGSFDSHQGRVTYGHRFTNGLEMLLSGTWHDSAGAENLPFTFFNFSSVSVNDTVAHRVDDDAFRSFFGTLAYKDLSLQGAFLTRDKGIPATVPGAISVVFSDPRTRALDERRYANLKYFHDFTDVAEVTAQIYYDRQDSRVDSLVLVPTLPLTLNREVQVGEWWGAELQLTKRLFDRHTLTLGAEYRDDFRQERRNFDLDPPQPHGQSRRSAENYGVYLQGDFGLLTNLHLNAGFRYDQYSQVDSTVNPRLALIYSPWPKTTFKRIYGTAFRAPNFLERENRTELPVKPETITTHEWVYEQGIGDHLRSSVSWFHNQIDDLISIDSFGILRNLKGANARGVSAELEGIWAGGVRSRASYSYQETEDRRTGLRLSDSPRHLAKANVSVPLMEEKVFASLEFQYTSRRTTGLAQPPRDVIAAEVPGFGVLNFTLFSQNLVKGLELSGGVYNLLDRRYSDPAPIGLPEDTIPQDGRTFRLKLTYRF